MCAMVIIIIVTLNGLGQLASAIKEYRNEFKRQFIKLPSLKKSVKMLSKHAVQQVATSIICITVLLQTFPSLDTLIKHRDETFSLNTNWLSDLKNHYVCDRISSNETDPLPILAVDLLNLREFNGKFNSGERKIS
ncbi:hypothetical protein X798_02439 [Onchocerca flexuosa]|uniref:Uncharacterized protein n=1 Tax=Onchocerca flexuosa TaxID=387005 RepID=A0A238BZR0_9BILA|nr:hypothetical protein X798_02439 [Onchocerca flexuosa]